jgi:hypothetical protein
MADPISVAGIALQVGDILSRVVAYGTSVKDARAEMRALTSELCTLEGALRHFDPSAEALRSPGDRAGAALSGASSDLGDSRSPLSKSGTMPTQYSVLYTILASIRDELNELDKILMPAASSIGKKWQSLRWPLRKDEAREHVQKLERLKTVLILQLTGDNQYVIPASWSQHGERNHQQQSLTSLVSAGLKTTRFLPKSAI